MTNTKTNTKMKADYTSLTPERNYWSPLFFLVVFVCAAYFGTIYQTNMNVIITAPSVVAATTTSLVRGGDGVGVGVGDGGGNIGHADLSTTSVVDNSFQSNTNSFVEEEVDPVPRECFSKSCTKHRGDEKACKGQGGCVYYPHWDYPHYGGKGYCAPAGCSGVSCGAHRSPECKYCPLFDKVDAGKPYCNGDCEWYDGDWWVFYVNAGCK
eukprot:CAMPEP_0170776232 /NCGR_PEP_ID=MMETSP0733-20121128/11042_1 /TAXON_ID=186038 /ORGANISM="Fragilariopsis kerguelensis, Strain L26-C5" /LENGTH=209 /DNA_ID=CAMNT_0011119163 /DNA_START=46 /DNA_END=675 /DNA_ORIENTATION=+